jgi:RNA polymerase sigma-70 factor, ECF subfamily
MMSLAPSKLLHRAQEQRLRQMVQAHFNFAWRTLRRLGVAEADLPDAAQQVFSVVAEKLALISESAEKSFIFGTALRVASHARRAKRRKREAPLEDAGTLLDAAPNPEQALQRSQAIEQLAEILDGMDETSRAVFVLFELEQLTMAEIARLQRVPLGTVASRLRRAREQFHVAVTTLHVEPEDVA